MQALSDIAVFVQVVRSGSFTAAAAELSLSKSVVSKYITRLERHLGAQLLNRTTRKLSLTEVGQVFYEQSRQGLTLLQDAETAVSSLQNQPRGTLRINVPMSFGVLHIAPLLPQFQRRFPELLIDMQLDDRKVDVVEAGFDVSVRVADLPDSSLVARRLGPCHHVVVAAPDYLQQHGVPATPADLADHNVITYQYQTSPHEWHFTGPDGRHSQVRVQGSMQMNNSLALRQALLNGAGITRTPSFVVGHDLQAGRLQKLLPDYTTLEMSIYAVFAQRQYLAPKVRAFIDFLAEQITDQPYWDA